MTIAAGSQITFEQYLTYNDGTDNRYEWVEGTLIEMPPESGFNSHIAFMLRLYLINGGLVQAALTQQYNCEIEVPIFKPKQPRNRFPDLVILRSEHIELTLQRLTIRLEMPPPELVVEVVSPGQINYKRDYEDKRQQYERRGIPEYWLIDPECQQVTVLILKDGMYQAAVFQGTDAISSCFLPQLSITAEQILNPDLIS
jgi:Uma2 family endonuclease